jgi:hypothetical protein
MLACRTYDLVEEYQPDYARALTDNDCSWMTHSAGLILISDTEQYAFTSAEEQYVTILVVPQYQLDDFDLQVTIDGAQVITSANPGSSFVDWIQVKVRAGARLVARTSPFPQSLALFFLIITTSLGCLRFSSQRSNSV